MAKKILISISDGMVERNLLKTDFFPLLKKSDVTIELVSSNEPYYHYLVERYASDNVHIHYVPYTIQKIDALFTVILRNSIHTYSVAEDQYNYFKGRYGRPKVSLLTYLAYRVFWHGGGIKLGRALLRWLYRQFSPSTYCADLLREIQPDLVFVPSINPTDYKLVQQAKKQGFKCIQMIKSWDNLTSKTFLAVLPDYLVTHNEVMKQEAIDLDDIPSERIFVSGIPQFDYLVTHQKKLIESRDSFYAKLNIDPKKQVILFSASGDSISPHDRDYLFMLDEAIEQGRLPADTHIQVRSHPKYTSDLTGVDKLTHITVERPFSYLSQGYRDWVFEEKDLAHWYNSIHHSAAVINVASTMAIDAAVLNRPIVSLGFDGYTDLPFDQSIRRYYKRDHYKNVVETDAISLVTSEQQLLDAITRYLQEPTYKDKERARLVKQQCYKLDGQSSKRLVDFLLTQIKGGHGQ